YMPMDQVTEEMRKDPFLKIKSVYERYFRHGTYHEDQDKVYDIQRKDLDILWWDSPGEQLRQRAYQEVMQTVSNDRALAANAEEKKGGIDFGSRKLNLTATGKAAKFNFTLAGKNLDPASIIGFRPSISRIVTVTSLPFLKKEK
ncbi:MAG: hypothetical protein HY591_03570, partial [Candidatus Omnitrophica bacterium]|nr:hypothetical protein [Candidatus Omnitrophota bacterium]